MRIFHLPLYTILLITLLCLTPSKAQESFDTETLDTMREAQKQAEERQEELEAEAEKAAIEVRHLQKQMTQTAAERQKLEHEASYIEARLAVLNTEEESLSQKWQRDRKALLDLLAALQSLETSHPPALAIHPKEATKAARTASLMAELSPLLKERTEDVKQNLRNLLKLRGEILRKKENLLALEEGVKTRRSQLSKFLATKKSLETQLRKNSQKEAERAAELAKKSKNLSELVNSLTALAGDVLPRLKPPAKKNLSPSAPKKQKKKTRSSPPSFQSLTGRFSEMRGRLRLPAAGRMTGKFGAPMASGGRTEGIKLKTRPRAQVVSPIQAHVEFAGEFGNYGLLLILNVGDGYHLILSGLKTLVTGTGKTVLAGEPLGEMGEQDQSGSELYFEIRKNGQPVNPLPWLHR